jgi:hypothetical protein
VGNAIRPNHRSRQRSSSVLIPGCASTLNAQLVLGFPSAALARKREALAGARKRSDPFSIFATLFTWAMNHLQQAGWRQPARLEVLALGP